MAARMGGMGSRRHSASEDQVPDVLADRYASAAMRAIWSPAGKIILERELWIEILRAQRDLGVDIPESAIRAYERVKTQVDLERIRQRERITRHDVKARIDEFCDLAGHQQIHRGLTSRDLTENVEQAQIRRSLELLRLKAAAALHSLARRAAEYRDLVLVGRTHNVPAQLTTLGKRLAMFGEELWLAAQRLEDLLVRYPLRGLKGPVGTQRDMIDVLGDKERVGELERRVAQRLGFERVLEAVGQIYPRSLDAEVAAVVAGLTAGPASLATTIRLMAGHELVSEGFGEGQVGSSAMPHKINARSCERVCGLRTVVVGFESMLASLAGGQWNEGDVACSVIRRVALPGVMLAADGLFETFLTILGEMEVAAGRIRAEVASQMPLLASTAILVEAMRRGLGREAAHEIIRRHAVEVVRRMREGRGQAEELLERLAADPRFPLERKDLEACVQVRDSLLGNAREQVDGFVNRVREHVAKVPGAAEYEPEPIL